MPVPGKVCPALGGNGAEYNISMRKWAIDESICGSVGKVRRGVAEKEERRRNDWGSQKNDSEAGFEGLNAINGVNESGIIDSLAGDRGRLS
jgi:hypothetical protein